MGKKPAPVFCGNVLVWPTEGSHWLNVKTVIRELIHRGHSVTILVSNASLFIQPKAETTEKFEVFNVPFKKDTIANLIEEIMALWLNNRPTASTFWQFYKELGKLTKSWHQVNRQICDAVLTNRELMAHLQGSGYDLLLSDPVTLCGDLVALKLALPFVYSLRFSPASTVERHCGKIPAPPSYTPAALSELTDHMSFGERIKNILSYHLQDYIFQSYWGEWDIYYSKVLAQSDLSKESSAHTSPTPILTLKPHSNRTAFLPESTTTSVMQAQPILVCPAIPEEARPRRHCEALQIMSGKKVAVLWLLAVLGYVSGGKVLVWPVDNSHWLNMEYILQELVARGHEVTVLLPSCFLILNGTQPSPFQFEVVEVPISKSEMAATMDEGFYFWFYEERRLPFWQSFYRMVNLLHKFENITRTICDGVVKNKVLLERLRASAFDVLLADPLMPSGELFAEELGIPLVYTIRFSMGNTVERLCGGLPAPPSYVPASLSSLTDKMTFKERLKNVFSYALQDIAYHYFLWGHWNQYYSDILDWSCAWTAEMVGQRFSWLLWSYACCWSVGFCGKVVVWPTDASHWINMKVMLEELVLRGHEVTVLVPSTNMLINYQDTSSPFTFEVLKVNFTQETLDAVMEDFINFWLDDLPDLFPWETMWKVMKDIYSFYNLSKQACDALVSDHQLIAKLHQAKFDVLVADPLAICGELAAGLLEIPFVYSFRFSEANAVERLCGRLPSPPSYVPASTMGLTDQMSFVERLRNFFFYLSMDLFFLKFWRDEWDGYYSNVLGRPTTLCETMGKAEIWLIRTYWDVEFPRPFLPNFEFVGGLHCQPAKPLPKEIEEFVQSSGEHGIVVFSLGSMVYNLTDERSNVIARALSQLPQNSRTQGAFAQVVDSSDIPVNMPCCCYMCLAFPVAGHPLAKAFITHGGTNGIYEAIYHGIPMVGIPMFADQHDNIAHMRAKGAAVELDFSTLTTQDLVDAVNTVINNSTYKENALRLSKIHHDQPIKPLDRAVFWIEFVMRHKGAKHLRPAAHHLTWYQYHCLDVLAFLFTCVAIAGFILVKCCIFCFRKCGRITKKKKE
ncbi:UNVERIFIED_CONTAM: hypothetical protein H355_015897 [Colinus virginianus]|nr:hypothetical protein H355_015897 [Colinus virginianus]